MLGKTVGEMVGDDVKVSADGAVTGTIHHVSGYTQFSSVEEEQSGNYFPITLTKKGTNMTIEKNGAKTRDNVEWDKDIVLRVAKSDKFTISVDGEPAITLTFDKATLEQASEAVRLDDGPKAASEAPTDKLTKEQLEAMTMAEIKAEAEKRGYKVSNRNKSADIEAFLEQQG